MFIHEDHLKEKEGCLGFHRGKETGTYSHLERVEVGLVSEYGEQVVPVSWNPTWEDFSSVSAFQEHRTQMKFKVVSPHVAHRLDLSPPPILALPLTFAFSALISVLPASAGYFIWSTCPPMDLELVPYLGLPSPLLDMRTLSLTPAVAKAGNPWKSFPGDVCFLPEKQIPRFPFPVLCPLVKILTSNSLTVHIIPDSLGCTGRWVSPASFSSKDV